MATSQQHFRELIVGLTAELAGRPLNGDLDTWPNRQHGTGTTSSRGRALVLYLLPEGQIEFTRTARA